jgi:hypothetical protein
MNSKDLSSEGGEIEYLTEGTEGDRRELDHRGGTQVRIGRPEILALFAPIGCSFVMVMG